MKINIFYMEPRTAGDGFDWPLDGNQTLTETVMLTRTAGAIEATVSNMLAKQKAVLSAFKLSIKNANNKPTTEWDKDCKHLLQ